MTYWDYRASQKIEAFTYECDGTFYAIIMAAMRRADTWNQEKLERAFPEQWLELKERYNAPGGRLPDDKPQQLTITEVGEGADNEDNVDNA